MAFWIFTFLEYTDFSLGTAKSLFARLERNGKWYIGPRTPNRLRIRKGDKVIFYQAGEGGRKFVGHATLSTGLQPSEEGDLFGFVIVSELCFWSEPLSIYDVGRKLSFVKHSNPAQYYFQIGIRRISEKDYVTIMRHKKGSC